METRKNPETDAQRDQHLAVCRHIYYNIIFNYGSVENYIVAKNTEINTAESKLQSYYDNASKGKTRRTAIIAGLENAIFTMKNSFANTLRDIEELNARHTHRNAPNFNGNRRDVNISAEGEKERITRYAGYALTDCKNKQYVGELELPNRLTIKFKYVYNLNGKDMYTVEDWQNGKLLCSTSHESRERILDYIADILATSEPPHSPETPQTAECIGEPCKLAQTA